MTDELNEIRKILRNYRSEQAEAMLKKSPAPEMSIAERRQNKGSYLWDDGKWVLRHEYYEKHGRPEAKRGPMIFVDNFEPFRSPVTDKVIRNRRDHDYDLKSTNSRQYEGFEQEQKEADRYKAEKEEKTWCNVRETMNKTMHEIEHGYRTPEEPELGKPTKALTWEFADAKK